MSIGVDVAWTKMINPQLESLTDTALTLSHTPENLHLNHNGDVNAGVIFSMSEMVGMGLVVLLLGDLAAQALVVVKNVNIDFVARASGRLECVAQISEQEKQQMLDRASAGGTIEQAVAVEVRDADQQLVSSATVLAYGGQRKPT